MQKLSLFCAILALALVGPGLTAAVQTQTPEAPAPQAGAASQAPAATAEPKFPPVNPANFTAASPTKEDVQQFLHTSWGYDANRLWEVYGIEKTSAPGVSKVTIFLAEKPNPQVASLSFFVTPDGHHLISQESLLDFGAHPYESNYRVLQQRADGPSQGAAAKQFELVEFADFQCPHCKDAEPIAKRLIQDFPQAHYVFEMFPLVSIHPQAFKAAAFGACVAQQGGNDDFFKYADAIFAGQSELDGQGADQALRNAVTASGLDPDKVTTCADSQAAKSAVDASLHLGQDVNVDETPTLFIDGRAVPMTGIPYEQLKQIVEWQFSLDKSTP
jgi:protein-disulfide isomerase